jgi:preprotein translocase subunit SecG
MIAALHIIYVVICLVLSVSILLQASKGGGLGAGLGGGGSAQTQVFGGRGAGGFLAKTTVVTAAIYMSMSLLLSWLSSKPQSELDLTGRSETTAAVGDPVIEEGSLQVNPDGTPLGSEPKADAPEGDAPKIEVKENPPADGPPIEIKVNDKPVPNPPADGDKAAAPTGGDTPVAKPVETPPAKPADTPPAEEKAPE